MNKRLYKSRNDKMLDGVCGGIAEYFDIDPTLVRLVWAVFGATGGGILRPGRQRYPGLHHCGGHHPHPPGGMRDRKEVIP